MENEDLVDVVCSRCRYYKHGCWYDKGDSETKIPCEALYILQLFLLMLQGVEI